ncbi:phenoloxidase-activating factor 1-like [Drosophila gunungcola]|nr:phenoloxidase-activating factor 1-like [Drosophila gunungcola]
MFGGSQVYFLFWALFNILSPIRGQHECGMVRESDLYNGKKVTEADEYTWIGRVGHGESRDSRAEFKCLSVLVSQRYAILPAHCAMDGDSGVPTFMELGTWRVYNPVHLGVCRPNRGGFCVPPKHQVDIEELVVHPRHRRHPSPGFLQYDIALAKLVRSVELTDYLQPICLPPADGDEANQVGQRLEMAGFKIPASAGWRVREDDDWRQKVTVHTASFQYCTSKKMIPVQLSENNLCAVRDKHDNFYPGSPLMGIEVVDGKPKNFYLIGISSGIISLPDADRDTFAVLRIAPFRKWILKNMHSNLTAE